MNRELDWLEHWYSAQCDGAWEHTHGVTIHTLDNPGWHITINLDHTDMEHRSFEPVQHDASDTDWFRCRVAERDRSRGAHASHQFRRFEGAGGPRSLAAILSVFQAWAESQPVASGQQAKVQRQ